MARVFITGSADGLGLLAGKCLLSRGHQVVLHGRNPSRAADIRRAVPDVSAVVTGDLETIAGMQGVAQDANTLGPFDAVIHNAGVGDRGTAWHTTDGVPLVFAVNVLATYVLTAQMQRPARMVYLSSSMHFGPGRLALEKAWVGGDWTMPISYGQSKFLVTAHAFAIARRWPQVVANAVDPGWVPTRMGGHLPPMICNWGVKLRLGLPKAAIRQGRIFITARPCAQMSPPATSPCKTSFWRCVPVSVVCRCRTPVRAARS